jgi:uncharacterized protein YukJ
LSSRRYCLVSGQVVAKRAEISGKSHHYHILLDAAGEQFRVAINTRSGRSKGRAADLLYFADDDFHHPLTEHLANIDEGVLFVASRPDGLALDYQRGELFYPGQMRRIPSRRPGPHNDLVEVLDEHVDRSIADRAARLYAFGTRWGPERRRPDQVFGFTPGNGVHDVHMNQGNRDEHRDDNGRWADGGLIFHDPLRARWCAIFLAFQSQSWHTDTHGDPIADAVPAAM